MAIGLGGSQAGFTYDLKDPSNAIVATATGTGSALSFGTFTTAGTYTVLATSNTNPACSFALTGNAVVTVKPQPAPGTYTLSATENCQGGFITITGSGLTPNVPTEIYYTLASPSGSGLPATPPPFTGVTTAGGELASNSPTYLIPGTYTVTVTSVTVNGCSVPVVGPRP